MKDDPIGSTFREGDVTLKVSRSKYGKPLCDGCWYGAKKDRKRLYNHSCWVHGHACTPANRKDKKHVIFKRYGQTC